MKTKERHYLIPRGFKQLTVQILVALFITMCAQSSGAQDARPVASLQLQANAADWKPVEAALGKAGSMQPGDVYKVSFPRTDLKVMVAGVQLKPALALGSWVAFKKTGDMTQFSLNYAQHICRSVFRKHRVRQTDGDDLSWPCRRVGRFPVYHIEETARLIIPKFLPSVA